MFSNFLMKVHTDVYCGDTNRNPKFQVNTFIHYQDIWSLALRCAIHHGVWLFSVHCATHNTWSLAWKCATHVMESSSAVCNTHHGVFLHSVQHTPWSLTPLCVYNIIIIIIIINHYVLYITIGSMMHSELQYYVIKHRADSFLYRWLLMKNLSDDYKWNISKF